MTSCLSVVASCFFKNFFSLFVTFLLFVTFINYFLLFRRARVYIVFIMRGGKGCTLIYFLFFFTIEGGRGAEVNVFFSLSLEMWKELLTGFFLLGHISQFYLFFAFFLYLFYHLSFFSLFFSICANVFSFILLSFPWFRKRH